PNRSQTASPGPIVMRSIRRREARSMSAGVGSGGMEDLPWSGLVWAYGRAASAYRGAASAYGAASECGGAASAPATLVDTSNRISAALTPRRLRIDRTDSFPSDSVGFGCRARNAPDELAGRHWPPEIPEDTRVRLCRSARRPASTPPK